VRRAWTIGIVTMLWTGVASAEQEGPSPDAVAAYVEATGEGHRLYSNGRYDEAERMYRSAAEALPSDAAALYFVACTQRARGDLEEALETFRAAAERGAESDAALQARALMNIAFIQEARGDLSGARLAWSAYVDFAEGHAGMTTYASNAEQRLSAITAVEELDAAYEAVRQRIAERAASEQ